MGDAGVCDAFFPLNVGRCRVTVRKSDIFSEEPAADGPDFFESEAPYFLLRRAEQVIEDFSVALAEEQGNAAIGAVLSGTGSDGTEGLKTVKATGGVTFAQDPKTANGPPCR